MGRNSKDKNRPSAPFSWTSFLAKTVVLYFALLGAIDVSTSWWDAMAVVKDGVRARAWAFPVIFAAFVAGSAGVEVMMRRRRARLEALRTRPKATRATRRRR